MGSASSSPFVFRRAVVSLHYKKSPIAGTSRETAAFWRALFHTTLTVDELASFWTAEDVRLLRLYHPDRLVAVMCAAMQQLDVLIFHGVAPSAEEGPVSVRSDENKSEEPHITKIALPSVFRLAVRRGRGRELSVDFTAATNALWIIALALPCCFEDIDALRAVRHDDQLAAASGEIYVPIMSQETRALLGIEERKESRFAADFAYHFFVRGCKCVEEEQVDQCSTNQAGGANAVEHGSGALPSTEACPDLASPGWRLVEMLVKLFFVPGFTMNVSNSFHRVGGRGQIDDAALGDMVILRVVETMSTGRCRENNGVGSSFNKLPDWVHDGASAVEEERRALVLRTLLIALSAIIFVPPLRSDACHCDGCFETSGGVNETQDARVGRSQQRQREVAALMTRALLEGDGRSLSPRLCVALLHVVRCCTRRHKKVPLFSIFGGSTQHQRCTNSDLLSHALAILVASIYSETGLGRQSNDCGHGPESAGVRKANLFLEVMSAVVGSSPLLSRRPLVAWSENHSGVADGGYTIPQAASGKDGGTYVSSQYESSLLEGLVGLLEAPLDDSLRRQKESTASHAPLAMHLLLWMLQHSTRAIHMVGGRPRFLLALVHNLLVSSAAYPSGYGEGQMVLLCFLSLLQHAPFQQLLCRPIPCSGEAASSTQRADAKQFLSELCTAVPFLPAGFRVDPGTASSVGLEATNRTREEFGAVCIRTYGDILALAVCYVVSPSSPTWFQPLYRTAVEVLNAMQLCCMHGDSVHLINNVLSYNVLLELASSFNYLCSTRVLAIGKETQLACARMAALVFTIVRSGLIRGTKGATQGLMEEQHDIAAHMLWLLATRSELFRLSRLVSSRECSSNFLEEIPADDRLNCWRSSDCIPRELCYMDVNCRETAPDGSAFGNSDEVGLGVARQLTLVEDLVTSRELNILLRMANAVRGTLTSLAVRGQLSAGECPNASSKMRSERCDSVQRESNSWAGCECEDVPRSQIPFLITSAVAQWLNDDGNRSTTTGMIGGSITVRRVSVTTASRAEKWLLEQLWVQVHATNLSVPMYDYRTAVALHK
ncbi:hypothetical protein TRVL_06299 [Trypanosoma vivax]|nr:hypothetical protein TRVL_06299 [Trypanosoma vivax]